MRLAPDTSRNYGVLGDALIELGRYREAFRAFDRMSALRPGLASYSRVSYARELLGRNDAARRAMKLALDAAGGQPEPTAWVHTQLGKLAWTRGSWTRPSSLPGGDLGLPGYVFALEPLALVEEAKGNRASRSRSLGAQPRRFQFLRRSRLWATSTRAAGRPAPPSGSTGS